MDNSNKNMEELDATDIQILRVMQTDCRLTTKELAAKIHLSTTPTFERLKRLEREGYIQKYVAILDPGKLDRGFVVYCNITMKQINKQIADEFTDTVQNWNEVTECYNVSGDCDYMLKIYVSSMKHYQEFVINQLGTLDTISHIRSVFVMDTLKLCYNIPL